MILLRRRASAAAEAELAARHPAPTTEELAARARLRDSPARELHRRIGFERASVLLTRLRAERRATDEGLVDDDAPSAAMTNLEKEIMEVEFSPAERRALRILMGVDGEQLTRRLVDQAMEER